MVSTTPYDPGELKLYMSWITLGGIVRERHLLHFGVETYAGFALNTAVDKPQEPASHKHQSIR